jgi:F420-dependent oxidoreductase-like protein
VKIGLQIIEFNWPGSPQNIGSTLANIARTADDAGFASLWVMDHFFQMGGGYGQPEDPMLEGYVAATHLAAHSRKARIGVLVSGVTYRHPGHLVKAVTSLDVLSGGRAYLGIGAGWYQREAVGLGLPFPPLNERFERLEEALKIAHQMWCDDTTPYSSEHYQLAEPMNHPQPISKPHPPILIGGAGERKTLRMVAQYADACNLFAGGSLEEFASCKGDISKKLEILRRHCDSLGRPFDDIERTALATAHVAANAMKPADILHLCEQLHEADIQHLILNMPNTHEITPIETFGKEIIPEVAAFA